MAFSSLFTLLDDITAVLDDVAVMTKVATKKTVGVLSDDLALNANQVSGKDIRPERELPIVWAIAKGSLVNKVILIPFALLLSIYLPSAITPLLMCGGIYLCFEGMEKLLHKFFHSQAVKIEEKITTEKERIKGAIRTDFILSAEIITIALGSVQEATTITKILTLSLVGIGITFFVYGLVGMIVKLDDIGLWLHNKQSYIARKIGKSLIIVMPYFMKALSIIGTIAMFLVGGSIVAHNLPIIHHLIENLHIAPQLTNMVDFITGLIIGLIACLIVLPLLKLRHYIKQTNNR